MGKTGDERLDGVLDYVEKNFPGKELSIKKLFDGIIGGLGTRKSAIADALSLGARDQDKSKAETERRNGVRTLLFLAFTEGKQPVALADTFKTKYLAMSADEVKSEIRGRLPVMDESPQRGLWAKGGFTTVLPTPKLQTAPAKFRYIVFGMMNHGKGLKPGAATYDTILSNPGILKTFLLSTSIIDQDHVATYYPYGFILEVPEENILSTRDTDQAFKNYSSDDVTKPRPEKINDRMEEVRRVAGSHGIKTPDEILGRKKTSNGSWGYNEIVVLGRTPTGSEIRPVGIFMKVDTAGNRYVRFTGSMKPEDGPFVKDEILEKIKATKFPIVQITDNSGVGK